MTKNPLLNALGAMAYVVLVANILVWGTISKVGGNVVIAPIVMLSLFTFSAAVMGYLFLYQPFLLFSENKKKAGVDLFLRTVAIFGGGVVILLLGLFTKAF